MLIELITPLMLATAPTMVEAPKAVYDHKAQQVVAHNGITKDLVYGAGSTRTYDMSGRPNDSDWD
jgi:hypothetical protein